MKTAHILWRDLLRQVRLFPLAAFLTALPLPVASATIFIGDNPISSDGQGNIYGSNPNSNSTALALAAQVPSLINYQGRLTDGSGSPLSGDRTMAVSVYDAASGGNLTYSEAIGTVSVANGTYSFQFGASGNGIVSALSGQDYLALTVNGTEETTRTRLLAVPFALKAKESADTQALNTQVTSLNGTVAELSASQTSLAGNVTTLESQTSTLGSNLTAVQAQTQSVSDNLGVLLAEYKVLGLSGNLTFGNSTASGSLRISNSGFGRLTVSGISYPTGFRGDWSSGIINQGVSQVVNVTFSPTAAQSYGGNIVVSSDATSGTGTIALSGLGARLVSLSGDLAFGNGTVNVPIQRSFTIANTGNMDLTVSGISYPAGFSGSWTGTIAPGASQSVTATFTPTAVQSFGGNLSVASNAAGGSGLLALSGIGLAAGSTATMITVQGGTLPQSSGLAGQPVSSFRIGKYEVTWGEWKEVRAWAVANGYNDLAGVGGTYPDGAADIFPVCYVSWYDVAKWSNAKSEKEGLTPFYQVSGATYKMGESDPTVNSLANGYRLPTDTEWEWAARGGVLTQGFTYSGSAYVNTVAWYDDNSGVESKAVGTKAANELGIHDMSGNLFEWCWDLYDSGFSFRRMRGGSFADNLDECTIAFRRSWFPDRRDADKGFRLARNSGQ